MEKGTELGEESIKLKCTWWNLASNLINGKKEKEQKKKKKGPWNGN